MIRISVTGLIILVLVGVAGARSHVDVIEVDGIINPVSAKFIIESIQKAEQEGAECLIIQMDTPGGLMESMKSIVKEILVADVPVVVYIYPSGSGAVSAGVFITLAAHIAVMAPGTNIGAAHPVSIGGQDTSKVMRKKVTNWAVAYIKSIAEKRGRNPDWAAKAVRESEAITEKEALEKGVIDFIASDLDTLLEIVDGKEVKLESGERVIHTTGAQIIRKEMNWRYKILDKISNPNIAYILLLVGLYGIIFELYNPGSIFPGVIGAISLILAFFALQVLPINWAGLLLILLAIVLFLLEIKITSYGLLTLGGIVCMTLGSLMLIRSFNPLLRVSWSVIIPAVVTTLLFFLFAVGMGIRAQRRQPTTGREGLVGERGVAITNIDPEGKVNLHGEIWSAESDRKIKKGEKVRVVKVEGLQVKVVKIKS